MLTDWSWLGRSDVHTGAQIFTDYLLAIAGEFIPQRVICERKSTRPWVNKRVVELVWQKRRAEGTVEEAASRKRCSDAIMEEYTKYIRKESSALQELPVGSKVGGQSRSD